MRIIVAECAVIYSGRGNTKLDKAVRMIMIKDDGSVSVHSDMSNKPLNYMGGKVAFNVLKDTQRSKIWLFEARNESIEINITKILSDTNHTLASNEPGLVRDGTESQLQAWLAADPTIINPNFQLVEREFRTVSGPVDLLCEDMSDGSLVAVEVKRVGLLGVVYQTVRYVDALEEMFPETKIRGMIAALDIRPKTQLLAVKKNLEMFIVPQDWKGTE